jgi:putative transposase
VPAGCGAAGPSRDKGHLGEVFIKVNGEWRYLWRAVVQDGHVLDDLVQRRRDTSAAKRFFRALPKKQCRVPRVPVTDKLRSYGPGSTAPVRPTHLDDGRAGP